MKKQGFTLAEILIALGVVGIIAAISIPGLATESKKKVWANSLSTAVSNFENAMTSYLVYENEYKLSDTKAWKEYENNLDHKKALGKKFSIKKKSDTAADYYGTQIIVKSLNTKITTDALSRAGITGQAYETNNGIAYFINIKNNNDIAAKIGIDINGKKTPNIIGRDIFVFHLTEEGYLKPYGSGDFGESEVTETNCSTKVTGTVGEHCAARLIGNGYKMDY